MTKAHKRRRFGRIVLATQDAKMEILDKEVAKVAQSWQDKIVIDVTNAYGVPPEKLGNLPSSVVISQALPGASRVKAFNHLASAILAQDPKVNGQHRVVFLSSDDQSAANKLRN